MSILVSFSAWDRVLILDGELKQEFTDPIYFDSDHGYDYTFLIGNNTVRKGWTGVIYSMLIIPFEFYSPTQILQLFNSCRIDHLWNSNFGCVLKCPSDKMLIDGICVKIDDYQ